MGAAWRRDSDPGDWRVEMSQAKCKTAGGRVAAGSCRGGGGLEMRRARGGGAGVWGADHAEGVSTAVCGWQWLASTMILACG